MTIKKKAMRCSGLRDEVTKQRVTYRLTVRTTKAPSNPTVNHIYERSKHFSTKNVYQNVDAAKLHPPVSGSRLKNIYIRVLPACIRLLSFTIGYRVEFFLKICFFKKFRIFALSKTESFDCKTGNIVE